MRIKLPYAANGCQQHFLDDICNNMTVRTHQSCDVPPDSRAERVDKHGPCRRFSGAQPDYEF
jgi:hypothetical protein